MIQLILVIGLLVANLWLIIFSWVPAIRDGNPKMWYPLGLSLAAMIMLSFQASALITETRP
jgi:hypothetical protein